MFRRPADGLYPEQVPPQHLPAEEQRRIQCLAVRGREYLPLDRQRGQEGYYDLALTHVAWMPHGAAPAMPANEVSRPVQVGLLGLQAIVQIPNPLAHLIQQASGMKGRAGAATLPEPLHQFMHTVDRGNSMLRHRFASPGAPCYFPAPQGISQVCGIHQR